jgi:hypothetical protein
MMVIAHVGLNHAKHLGRRPLFEAEGRDALLPLDHAVHPNQKRSTSPLRKCPDGELELSRAYRQREHYN